MELGWLTHGPGDIFRLRKRRSELVGREGWQDKSVDNLLTSIEAKRRPDASRLLFGLGIRHVGAVTARDLLKRFHTLPALRETAAKAHVGPCLSGENASIGPSMALAEAVSSSPSFQGRSRWIRHQLAALGLRFPNDAKVNVALL